jgi:N utilization substance protein B
MATPRDIRRLAFQILYQLDARGGQDADAVLASMVHDDEELATDYTEGERKKAFLLATEAFADRKAADAFMEAAAPGWPAHRQAAVDRAILRLAHHEMVSGRTHPKIAVNEAVELAKAFSTEKSPAFVNGLLDKVLKKVLKEGEGEREAPRHPGTEASSEDSGGPPPTGESPS